MIYAVLILSAPVALLVWQHRYFKREKDKCLKYLLYEFRDELVLKIAESDYPHRYEELYTKVNNVLSNMDSFSFSFFSLALNEITDEFTEKLIEKDKAAGKKYLKQIEKDEIVLLKIKFLALLSYIAKQSNFFFKIALSHLGLKVLLYIYLSKSIISYAKNHPDMVEKYKTVKTYSLISNLYKQTA